MIYLIDQIKQKNDGDFMLVDSVDVAYGDSSVYDAITALQSSAGDQSSTLDSLGTSAYKDFDTTVTSGSANLVTSGAVYTAINSAQTTLQGNIDTVSSNLSTLESSLGTSAKVDYDTTVTSGSAKLITSGGVYTAINNAQTTLQTNIDTVAASVTSVSDGLGTAAAKDYTTSVTSGSADLVTSGAVYTSINTVSTAVSTLESSLGTSAKVDYDTTVTTGSTNLITSGAVYTAINNAQNTATSAVDTLADSLGTAAYKDFESTVTSASANLITSGAVYTAINSAQTTLQGNIDTLEDSLGTSATTNYDTTVTSGSTNLITSGGVYTAINSAQTTLNSAITTLQNSLGDSATTDYDTVVTSASANLVTSGAVYTAISNAQTTLESSISDVQDAVDALEAAGGEPNVIETVKVNGTALTVTEKTVDITVTTETEITTMISNAIAEVVAGADESLDTLKEIADWINTHADSASAMNSSITANADDIAELKALVGSLPETATSTTVVAYISEMIDSIEEYTHPTYTARTSNLYKITVDSTGHVSAATAVTASDIEALGVAITDTTYEEATTTTAGLLSASDKAKLDTIELATDEEVEEILDEIFGASE